MAYELPTAGAEFYQVVGYKGHFRSHYWRTNIPENNPHEYAEETPAAQAIAGEGSPLYCIPDDSPPFVELVLGIRPHGAMALLIPSSLFHQYVMPRRGYTAPKRNCPAPHRTSTYLSLSPIRFTSQDELEQLLKLLRPQRPSQNGGDDSKMNKYFPVGNPKPERAWFEQVRLLWYVLVNGRTELLQWYGLPPLPAGIRMAYLAHTLWVDPNVFDIPANEEDDTLDVGWYEPATSTARHFPIEEHDSLSKASLPKTDFEHGESTTTPKSDLASTISSLLSAPGSNAPLVLVTHDWPRMARFLRNNGIDTTSPNWHIGVGELLGFERPAGAAPVAVDNQDGGDNGYGGGRDNGYGDRNGRRDDYDQPRGRAPPSRSVPDSKPNIKEEEDEKPKMKTYGRRWDSSSPVRRRSLSPRSRSRLAVDPERKYRPPVFRPDSDDEEGEIRSPSRPSPPTTTDETPVKPDPDAPGESSGSGLAPNDATAAENANEVPNATAPTGPPEIYVVDLRLLMTTLVDAPRPYITYPPLARKLGLPVDGWCAGNQAVQMHTALSSLVSGDPIHIRKEQVQKLVALPAPPRPTPSENPPPPPASQSDDDEYIQYDED